MATRKAIKRPLVHNENSFTKDQLKAELRKRGLKTSGNKVLMAERLRMSLTEENQMAQVVQRCPQVDRSQTNGLKSPAHAQGKRSREKMAREQLVLWRKPLLTISFASRQLLMHIATSLQELFRQKFLVTRVGILLLVIIVAAQMEGPHRQLVEALRKQIMWCLYWIGLGVLSSVGLGTGLHTFVLYLGPHIASVTMAAYECGSLDFPEPPYPNSIECPTILSSHPPPITIWGIMSKVRLEAMMWGLGTALGELPPYFMARAARLSGYDPDDEDDLREFQERQNRSTKDMSMLDHAKLSVERIVERVGFLGILACASIPNPLFDLAGITCGHFLVPFWTFFGATVVGKAIFKMHLQKLFVIMAFNETLIAQATSMLSSLPYVGAALQKSLKQFLDKQKQKLHAKGSAFAQTGSEGNILGVIFECFVFGMIVYFVISILNSLAQSYHKRKCKESRRD